MKTSDGFVIPSKSQVDQWVSDRDFFTINTIVKTFYLKSRDAYYVYYDRNINMMREYQQMPVYDWDRFYNDGIWYSDDFVLMTLEHFYVQYPEIIHRTVLAPYYTVYSWIELVANLMVQGVVILYVPRGAHKNMLGTLVLNKVKDSGITIAKLIVIVDDAQQLTITIEALHDMQDVICSVSWYIGVGATVVYKEKRMFNAAATLFCAHTVYVSDNAVMTMVRGAEVHRMVVWDMVDVILYGRGARVSATFGISEKHNAAQVIITTQRHFASDSTSIVLVKGVLHDASQLHYRGTIEVLKNVHYIIAKQLHKNLVLGPLAKVTSKPSLEVLADKIHCSHGASIITLDDEYVWYMQSRGIKDSKVRRILEEQFLQDCC